MAPPPVADSKEQLARWLHCYYSAVNPENIGNCSKIAEVMFENQKGLVLGDIFLVRESKSNTNRFKIPDGFSGAGLDSKLKDKHGKGLKYAARLAGENFVEKRLKPDDEEGEPPSKKVRYTCSVLPSRRCSHCCSRQGPISED